MSEPTSIIDRLRQTARELLDGASVSTLTPAEQAERARQREQAQQAERETEPRRAA